MLANDQAHRHAGPFTEAVVGSILAAVQARARDFRQSPIVTLFVTIGGRHAGNL